MLLMGAQLALSINDATRELEHSAGRDWAGVGVGTPAPPVLAASCVAVKAEDWEMIDCRPRWATLVLMLLFAPGQGAPRRYCVTGDDLTARRHLIHLYTLQCIRKRLPYAADQHGPVPQARRILSPGPRPVAVSTAALVFAQPQLPDPHCPAHS